MIKMLLSHVKRLLEEYSPIALVVLIAPFFLPIDRHLHRALIIFGCALPGLLTLLVKPSILKKPVFIGIVLFILYFSLQDLRGLPPISFPKIKWQCIRAFMLFGPALMVSMVSPNRKYYPHAIWLILFSAVLGSVSSLFTFYSENLFPAQRFIMAGGYHHPGHSAMKCGFAVVLASCFFLQHNSKYKWLDGLTLICLSIILFAMLMSHVRTATLAMLAAVGFSLILIKHKQKKLILISVIATVTGIYLTVMTLPDPAVRVRHMRPEGTFSLSSIRTLNGRTTIWKELLSLMTKTDWVAGKGLGKNYFRQDDPPEGIPGFYKGPYGYEIHTHSGYIWALYFGGIIGLALLLYLGGAAGISSLLAEQQGIAPAILLLFCGIILLTDTKSLLVGHGGTPYLIFWVPLGLAAGFPLKKR